MAGFQFQAKLMAAVVVASLLVGDAPPASALLPYGPEKLSSMAFKSRFGWRKMDGGREGGVSLESDKGKVEGLSFRMLRSRLPSPPPAPVKNGPKSTNASPPPLVQ